MAAPDNGFRGGIIPRGSVSGRKGSITKRITEMYSEDAKVSIAGKSFRLMQIRVHGDSAQLGTTLFVELYEATKKGRAGMPVQTLRMKNCSELTLTTGKKSAPLITYCSARTGAIVLRDPPEAEKLYRVLDQSLAEARAFLVEGGGATTSNRPRSMLSVHEAGSLGQIAEQAPASPTESLGVRPESAKVKSQKIPPKGIGGVRGAAMRAAAAHRAQQEFDVPAKTTPARARSAPGHKGVRRNPSVYDGFDGGDGGGGANPRRRGSTYTGFDDGHQTANGPSVPHGFGTARPRAGTAYDGFAGAAESAPPVHKPKGVRGRQPTVYGGFDDGDGVSGKTAASTKKGPSRKASVYGGFEQPLDRSTSAPGSIGDRRSSVGSASNDAPIPQRRTSTYGGFDDGDGDAPQATRSLSTSSVASSYGGFDDEGVGASDQSTATTSGVSSGNRATLRPRRRASTVTPLGATVEEEAEANRPPEPPHSNGAVRKDWTLPKGAALSHRDSLLAESVELEAMASKLEEEIAQLAAAELAVDEDGDDVDADDLAFLLDDLSGDKVATESDTDAIAAPAEAAEPLSPQLSEPVSPSNPFGQMCADCGDLKLDGWVDIAVDEAWYCRQCWEIFALDDGGPEDAPLEAAPPAILVEDEAGGAAGASEQVDPRAGSVAITYLGQTVALAASKRAARAAVTDAQSVIGTRVDASITFDKGNVRIVDGTTGMALAVFSHGDVSATFVAIERIVTVFVSDGRSGVSQCYVLEFCTSHAADSVNRAFSDVIMRSEKSAIKDNLTIKRGRSGSVAFAKRASVRHGKNRGTIPPAFAGLGADTYAGAGAQERKAFSFRRRTSEAKENRKSFVDGALGPSQEDRQAPIALYQTKYLGAHIVATNQGGTDMVADAAMQAADLVKDGASVESADAAIVVSLGAIQAVDMATSEELLTLLPFTVKLFHCINDKKFMKKLKPLKVGQNDAMVMGIVHTKAGGADAESLTVELFSLGKGADAKDLGSLLQRVVEMDNQRMKTLRAFEPVDLDDEENTDELAPGLAEIPRHELECIKMLGKGEYGEVYLGDWKPHGLKVAAKLARKKLSLQDASNFLGEAEIMAPLRHANIVNLLGVQVRRRPWLIVLEFAECGALLDLLKTMRSRKPPVKLSAAEQMYVGYQVASALEYVGSSHRLVHMDLATRNCLVSARTHIKVADFGVAQIMDEGQNYWKQTYKMRLPGRWLAPECLSKKRYSAASDVWAFGITLWEMTSGGRAPYPNVKLTEVTKHVREGGRCPRLPDTDDRLWDIMNRCWMHKYNDRPSFGDLCLELAELGQAETAGGRSPLRDLGLLSSDGPNTPEIKWAELKLPPV
mmetsp:Transcript_2991/g.9036  ORF Transcript_2991/g.9036 Transcript_2991/m.9036 type:complete len:1345 (+) Transcript_2991:206-4240(+)